MGKVGKVGKVRSCSPISPIPLVPLVPLVSKEVLPSLTEWLTKLKRSDNKTFSEGKAMIEGK